MASWKIEVETFMPPTTIVFDLDGTIVDTAPDLIHACNHVLAGADLGPVPAMVMRPWISFGSKRMIEVALGHHGEIRGDAEIERMWRQFLDFYAANIAVDSRPYPGVIDVLDRLEADGRKLAVCTNKLEGLSRQLLDTLGLSHRFSAICGRDTFPICKPDGRHLTGTIEAAGGDRTRAVMVGDSDTDVTTARNAGIPVIGVTFGYTEIPMRDLGPDAAIDSYAQFDAALYSIRTP